MPNDPIDLRQDRREWLKTSVAALGASMLPLSAVAAETSQGEAAPAASQTKATEAKPAAQRRMAPRGCRLQGR